MLKTAVSQMKDEHEIDTQPFNSIFLCKCVRGMSQVIRVKVPSSQMNLHFCVRLSQESR